MNQHLFDHRLISCYLVPVEISALLLSIMMLNSAYLLRIFCVLAYLGYAVAWIGLVRTFPLAEQTNNNKRIAANATILESKRNQVSRHGCKFPGGIFYKRKEKEKSQLLN